MYRKTSIIVLALSILVLSLLSFAPGVKALNTASTTKLYYIYAVDIETGSYIATTTAMFNAYETAEDVANYIYKVHKLYLHGYTLESYEETKLREKEGFVLTAYFRKTKQAIVPLQYTSNVWTPNYVVYSGYIGYPRLYYYPGYAYYAKKAASCDCLYSNTCTKSMSEDELKKLYYECKFRSSYNPYNVNVLNQPYTPHQKYINYYSVQRPYNYGRYYRGGYYTIISR